MSRNGLLGFLIVATIALPACCDDPGPCLPWARVGETYSVELVQLFVANHDDDPNAIVPYEGYHGTHRSCGAGLDLEVGDGFTVRAAAKNGAGASACSCGRIRAEADIDGVKPKARLATGFAPPYFAEYESAAIGADCEAASYTIGIVPFNPDFIERGDAPVATDHVLFRSLAVSGDPTACLADGSHLADDPVLGACWDSWAIRIRDSSGNLITHDISSKTDPPAGKKDSGT